MIYLGRFCCVCLNRKERLEKLSVTHKNNVSYYDQLLLLIPQLNINEVKDVVYICEDCKICVDNLYKFHKTCLSNNMLLWTYLTKLRLDKNSKFVDSLVINKLTEGEIRKYVSATDDMRFRDFEKIVIKTEFESIDDDMMAENEMTSEPLVNFDPLSINTKKEIETVDTLRENASMVNRIGGMVASEKTQIKDEGISLLHTEFVIGGIKNEKDVDNINYLKTPSGNDDIKSNEEHDIVFISELCETSMDEDEPPDNINLDNSSYIPKIPNDFINKSNDFIILKSNPDEEIRYKCDKCNEFFNTNSDFKNHNIIITENVYKCEICNESFDTNCNLKIHSKTHNEERLIDYKICNKTFRKGYLKIHLRYHTGERPYKCEICVKAFVCSSALRKHIRTHTNEKPYQCEICNKSFISSSNLKCHSKSHTGEKPHKCNICNKSFVRKTHLQIHTRIHTGERSYKCEICNKYFRYDSDYKKHIKNHNGDKPYKCETCKKSFTTNSDLNKHTKIHSDEKPFKCDTCQKGFILNSELRKHARIHSDIKPHKCDTCNKSFVSNSELRKHLRYHTGEKLYKCEICNKAFTNSSNWKNHVRMHTGDKPYKCEICNVGFSRKLSLKKHILNHTSEQLYKCEICHQTFSKNNQLIEHLKTHIDD